jgi:uncharacterized protein YjiS (DUF1127 family)
MSATIPLPVRADLRRQEPFAAWVAQRSIPTQASAASTRLALMNLDNATLRDIGFVRAEIESVAAEAHGAVALTRARLQGHAGSIGH